MEHWNPRSGCWVEADVGNEVWVRIVGLPISLWSPMILKRVGDECGGFITVDEQTKTMGELQWARILVKSRGEVRPSVLEIEVEEEVYALSLWWECRPVLRRKRKEEVGRKSVEVKGDGASRAEQRVAEEQVSVRLEMLNSSDEDMGEQGGGSGWAKANRDQSLTIRNWASTGKTLSGLSSLGPIVGPKEIRRAGGLGLANGPMGLKLKGVVIGEDGPKASPSSRKWAALPKAQSRQKTKPQAKAQFFQWAAKSSLI